MRRGVPFIPPAGNVVSIVDGFQVRHDPTVTTIAEARGLFKWRYIAVSVRWFLLWPRERTAVVMHEIGHFRHYHLAKRLAVVPLFWTKWASRLAAEQELEADLHAARAGYANELIAVLMQHCKDGDLYPQLNQRVARLKAARMEFDIRWRMAWRQIEFWSGIIAVVAVAAFTLALINPVGAQTTLSNCDYIASVLATCKAAPTVTPPPVPPVATAPPFAVGILYGVGTTGLLTGVTTTATAGVLLNFDGSQVQYAITITPLPPGGGFFYQLDPHFHDGAQHFIRAWAIDAQNNQLFFDNANPTSGGAGGFSFIWK